MKSKRRRSIYLVTGISEFEWHRCWQALYPHLGLTSETNREVFFDGIIKAARRWRFVVRRSTDGRHFSVPCIVRTEKSGTKAARELIPVQARRGYPTDAFCPECGAYLPGGHALTCRMRHVRRVEIRIHSSPRFLRRARRKASIVTP